MKVFLIFYEISRDLLHHLHPVYIYQNLLLTSQLLIIASHKHKYQKNTEKKNQVTQYSTHNNSVTTKISIV